MLVLQDLITNPHDFCIQSAAPLMVITAALYCCNAECAAQALRSLAKVHV